jgi:hypothetical protein
MPVPIVPTKGIIEQTPDPFQVKYVVRLARNNVKGRWEIITSKDAGSTFQVLLPEPGAAVRAGSVLTFTGTGTEWLPPVAVNSLAISGLSYAEMSCAGTISAGQIFGYFTTPASQSMKCLGLQVSLQAAATGAPVRVDFVSLAGAEAGKVTVLPVSTEYAQNLFDTPLTMPPGSSWRLKVKQVGSILPGEFLTARLILSPS